MSLFDWIAVAVWAGVILSTVILRRSVPRSRQPARDPAPRLLDLSEAAFMAGGPGTVVDAALVSLLCDGRMVAGGPGIVQVRPGVRATDPAERAVLQAHQSAPSGWLYQIRYAAMREPAVQETGDALADRGLIAPPGDRRGRGRHGVVQAVLCGVLLMLSLPLTFVALVLQSESGSGSFRLPFIVEVLPVLVGGIVLGLRGAYRSRQRITRAGAAALRDMRARHRADQSPYVQTSLFGLGGLRDPYLRGLLLPAARDTRLAAAQARIRPGGSAGSGHSTRSSGSETAWGSPAEMIPVVWCAGSDGGGSSGSGGSSCGSGGSGCGSSSSSCSSGSSCGSSGSSCGSSSSSCGGSSSSCSSSSSCGSSSGSSCSSSS
ncbi:TIGR04222 domain-containing membrane protein [Streptomyces sp. NBC_00503]|uniref:TIGR04222 domain-containing membrane protein n=1 Tax=Streptomyces sp. NBC_00503 TaxID=2903659 RepID=UPI002E815FA5|nr:TIGR04222 domain-containing membrane protein [Streptomyces sp. NBC_00503]WUD84225.1 TIGR04222 domain-containing membrane protein [Streptomyces sp. NBC_00503]